MRLCSIGRRRVFALRPQRVLAVARIGLIWNGIIDRSPGAIVRCAGAADVIAAVNFARDQNLVLAVRAGAATVPQAAACAIAE